eukprot:1287378-Amphidinium_carterae.1
MAAEYRRYRLLNPAVRVVCDAHGVNACAHATQGIHSHRLEFSSVLVGRVVQNGEKGMEPTVSCEVQRSLGLLVGHSATIFATRHDELFGPVLSMQFQCKAPRS